MKNYNARVLVQKRIDILLKMTKRLEESLKYYVGEI